ncbi:MAG: autotransporter outer membrane beta-barrel domain-containing protein, partial [Pontibacterium sp.]
ITPKKSTNFIHILICVWLALVSQVSFSQSPSNNTPGYPATASTIEDASSAQHAPSGQEDMGFLASHVQTTSWFKSNATTMDENDPIDASFGVVIANNLYNNGSPIWLNGVAVRIKNGGYTNLNVPNSSQYKLWKTLPWTYGNSASVNVTYNYNGDSCSFTLSKSSNSYEVTASAVSCTTPSTSNTSSSSTASTKQETKRAVRNLIGKQIINITSQSVGLSGLMTGNGAGFSGFGGAGVNGILGGNLTPLTLNATDEGGNFAMSLNQYILWEQNYKPLYNNTAGEPANPAEERTQKGMTNTPASPVNIWMKGRWTDATENRGEINQKSEFGVAYLGADYRYNKDMLIGLTVQYDWFEEKSYGLNTEGEGDGWMVGPYVVSRLKDNLILDARASWGKSYGKVRPLATYWDSYETERWMLEANLTGSFDHKQWHIAPSAGLVYFEEEQKEYTDSNGLIIDAQTSRLGSFNFGPTVYYQLENTGGTTFRPMFGL